VCDPPRAGLHKSVLRALLACERIRRLVFVSCNPDSLRDNAVTLCSPPPGEKGL
jgi:tRNA (uracil-5-)-methyltransferase